METRTDFQRLLEDMDKLIKRRQEELAELDERLDTAREQLSQKEAKELTSIDQESAAIANQQAIDDYIRQQRVTYERHIAQLGDDLAGLESINLRLAKENDQLKYERESLRESNEQLKAKTLILGENLNEIQRANFDLNIRLAHAEKESQQQQRLLKRSAEQDQVLMNAFNDKLESLKQTLSSKDQEIARLRSDNQFTLESLGIKINYNDKIRDDDADGDIDDRHQHQARQRHQQATTLASSTSATDGLIDSANKQRVIEIAKALREKDAQIELLKTQVLEAANELEKNANLIESLTKKQSQLIDQAYETNREKLLSGNGGEYVDTSEELSSRCKMLESELEAKDKQLHLIETRIHHYEMILPSKIIDLIEEFKTTSSSRDQTNELVTTSTGLPINHERENEKISVLADNLIKVLEELNSSQRLLDIIEQLKSINASKDAQVRRLVTDLNNLDAKLNSIQYEQQGEGEQQHLNRETFSPGGESQVESTQKQQDDVNNDQQQQQQPQDMSGVQLIESRQSDMDETGNNDDRLTSSSGAAQPMAVEGGQARGSQSNSEGSERPSERQVVDTPKTAADRETSGSAQLESTTTITTTGEGSSSADMFKANLHGRSGTSGQPANATTTTADMKRKSIEQSIKIRSSPSKFIGLTTKPTTTTTTTTSIESALDLQYRLRQLESENQLLELAMKEILMSIRWSDSQCSTILIDCPSLERLCQLIEARFITNHSMGVAGGGGGARGEIGEPSGGSQQNTISDLIQFITMKAELDVVRGQNEQLRADLKAQRREYHQLMQSNSHQQIQTADEQSHLPGEETRASGGNQQEVQCQTEVEDLSCRRQDQQQQQQQEQDSSTCRNCMRYSKLTEYFLACIAKVEAHVTSSDENFVNRLMALHQLTHRLGHDLTAREDIIRQLNRKCDSLSQQRFIIQTKLNSLENRINVHTKVCPLSHYYSSTPQSTGGGRHDAHHQHQHTHIPTASPIQINNPRNDIYLRDHNYNMQKKTTTTTIMTTKTGVQVPLRENKMTITVLTSIIDCLKAMLNFKDERLQRLERLLVEQ